MDFIQDISGLPDDFRQAAAPALKQEQVTFHIDADVMAWLRSEGLNVQRQVNDLLRFYKDSSEDREAAFQPDAWEPGEMVPAPVLA